MNVPPSDQKTPQHDLASFEPAANEPAMETSGGRASKLKARDLPPERAGSAIRGRNGDRVDPDSSEEAYSMALRAYHLMAAGRLKDARSLAEGLVVADPYDAYYHSLLGSIYLRQEQADAALEEYSLAIDLGEGDVDSYVNRGEILLNKGSFELAIQDFRKALELDPDATNPMSQRARMLVAVSSEILHRAMARSQ